jgi:NADH-quinone oxidoreductase subunit L
MEGPTPVSALIHAATMVAAGVYLVGRMYPMFTPDAFLFIAYTGLITLFLAATIALTQNDIKKVLAYSTTSQLGFMVMGLGVGGYTAGLAHLATHAAFKACLFLGSGSVIHAVHSQDIREMGGLRKKMPITFWTFLVATLAIAGVPGFSGFFSKDMILAAALEFGMRQPHHLIIFFGALLTAGMTAFYMFRMVIMTFFGKPKDHHKYDHAHESPPNMWVPLVILAILSFSFWFKSPFVEKGWFQILVQKPATVANLPKAPAAEASPASHPEAAATASSAHGEAGPHAAPSAAHGEAQPGAAHGPGHEAEGDHDAHLAHTAHVYAMYSSVAVGAVGIVLAFGVYLYGWVNPERVANSLKPVYNLFLNKWYFDELYEATIIEGSKAFSRGLAWFDLYVVDGLVNLAARLGVFLSWLIGVFDNKIVDGAVDGVANVTIASGSALRRLQTGKLYHYVFALAGGALIIFLIKAF